ncbi:MAG: D-2-hydroxyacid dehydrogenase [Marinoscillum sp.]|uniref:D-2-hydroxyacid dehydrogenase n=1 Tax=Marinoscillum sp. TaxID=2024838 RepID=UPI003300ECD9
MPYKIVVLDGIYANPGDLSWEALETYGNLTVYDRTSPEQVMDRAMDADILIVNKVELRKPLLDNFPHLKMIVISATGMNNVDLEAAKALGVVVKNVVGYGAQSVAQHTFALILELTNRVSAHNDSVQKGEWDAEKGFSYTTSPVTGLDGKTLGIYGFGSIGQEVASIGRAFGMRIMVVSNHAVPTDYPFYEFVNLRELFEQSDLISLHAPLRDDNKHVVNSALLSHMKPDARLINTARGPLVHEEDLKSWLIAHPMAGAALDVLETEPPGPQHILFGLPNCIITPHMAWTAKSARKKLIVEVTLLVKTFVS